MHVTAQNLRRDHPRRPAGGPSRLSALRGRGAWRRAGAGLRTWVLVAIGVASIAVISAQQPGVHPVSGRVYALPMSVQGAPWLEREEREDEEAPERALRILKIPKGAVVADIGTGSGYMAIRMARIVGPQGKVYANDIQLGMLDLLRKNVEKAKVANVIPVLGTIEDPRLPTGSLDLVLMVDVYHEFSQPQAMLQKLRAALKPDGRLVLLEYRAEDPKVPILPAHKMTREQVELEVEHEGFTLKTVNEELPRQHLFVFTKS
jgi:SAM-dependent methyltransferase